MGFEPCVAFIGEIHERLNPMKPRNDQAAALFHRAGNAGCAVAVDTRAKSIPSRKRRCDRKATRQKLRSGRWE